MIDEKIISADIDGIPGIKFKPGDRVLVRVQYFIDHHICVPALCNRYGTISEIKYEYGTPFDSIGISIIYNVKMDNGADLVIDDPTCIFSPPHYDYPPSIPYDTILNTHAMELILDSVNKTKEFNTNVLQKEKQMASTSIYKVIFNDPATIILWDTFHYEDKECEINGIKCVKKIRVRDKTVVKCAKGEKFNKYNGFCAAVTKRIFETNSAIQHIIREAQDNSWQTKKLLKEIEKAGKKVKAQRENMKETKKK